MNEQYKNLIEKIKEVLPKKAGYCALNENTSPEEAYQIARNDFISSLPQVMEVIKGEIEEKLKDIDSATNPMWIRKQIIDLITLRNDKETLKKIMKDLPDIIRGKDFPTKHGILSIGKLISKKK